MPALMYQIPLLIAACAWIVLVVYLIHPILSRRRPVACPACGYPTMTAEEICVECGQHRPDALRRWRRRRLVRSACLLLVALAMTATAAGAWYYAVDWPDRVPNWVLVRIVPVHPEVDWSDGVLQREVFDRSVYAIPTSSQVLSVMTTGVCIIVDTWIARCVMVGCYELYAEMQQTTGCLGTFVKN